MRPLPAFLAVVVFSSASAGAQSVFQVADINKFVVTGKTTPGYNFAALGNTLLFDGYDRANGGALWQSDGTAAGTELVQAAASPYGFTELHGALYFFTDEPFGLWRTDGTSKGTVLVKSFPRLPDGIGLGYLARAGDLLFFDAPDAEHGHELWKSDGTAEGTSLVADLDPGPDSSYPSLLTALGGRVFFQARSGGTTQLWQSDGTEAGTFVVHDLGADAIALVATAGPLVYFAVFDPATGSATLWRTDGTVAGTVALHDFLTEPGCLPFRCVDGPSNLVDLDGIALFVAKDIDHGWELWRSDGTVLGTVLVKDVRPGYESSLISGLMASGRFAYFAAEDGVHGRELWRTDGTDAGTFLVKDIVPGPDGSSPVIGAIARGLVFFEADDGVHGREPWRSDGTEAGTFLLQDIEPYKGASQPWPFLAAGDTVFFGASRDGARLLWRTDGTPAGTVLADDSTHGASSFPFYMTDAGGRLFFSIDETGHGDYRSLWESDGTSQGTRSVESFCTIYGWSLRAFHGTFSSPRTTACPAHSSGTVTA